MRRDEDLIARIGRGWGQSRLPCHPLSGSWWLQVMQQLQQIDAWCCWQVRDDWIMVQTWWVSAKSILTPNTLSVANRTDSYCFTPVPVHLYTLSFMCAVWRSLDVCCEFRQFDVLCLYLLWSESFGSRSIRWAGEWATDLVCDFSLWATSETKADTETKFGSLGGEDDGPMSNTCIVQIKRAIPHSMVKNMTYYALQSTTSNRQNYEWWHIARRCDGTL